MGHSLVSLLPLLPLLDADADGDGGVDGKSWLAGWLVGAAMLFRNKL